MDPTNPKRMHLDPEPDMDGSGEGAMVEGPEIGRLSLVHPPGVAAPTTPYKILPSVHDDEDWKYSMRRSMQEIVPGLYLGPYSAASKSQLGGLKAAGITHIVCVRHLVERSVIRPVHEGHFIYMVMEIENDSGVSLIPMCNRVIKFIDGCFRSGGKVLVHGNAGLNRSAALVVAYIMATYGVALKDTLRFVQSRRFAANPSGWFLHQLQEYEAIYQAMHDVPVPLPAEGDTTPPPKLKRSFVEISADSDDDNDGGDIEIDGDLNIDVNMDV